LAKRTGKPVRIVLTREEVFACSKTRHEIAFDIQSAFSKDGVMLAKKCVHVLNGGSYGGSGIAACAQSLIWANLPYKIPAVDIIAKRVYTNNISGGAMRGYGSCQVHFANEVHMDAVANAMGIDPVDLRRINGATPNYDSPSGLKITSCAFKQTLDAAEEAIHWKERKGKLEPNEGVGFAGSGFVSGTGFPILETPKYTSANVLVRLNRHGYGCVYTGSNDIGQGSDTVMTLIAAEELGLDMNEMKLVQSDTSLTPFDSGSYGSRVTFLTGNATRNAAVDLKRKLLKCIGEKWNVDPHSLECIDHAVVNKEDTAQKMPIAEACSYYMQTHNGDELTGVGSYFHDVDTETYQGNHNRNFAPSYSFSTGACHVRVDEETGVVDISDFIFAADCGRPLNKRAAEGQLEGSIQMVIVCKMVEKGEQGR
jgi:CO/xanthine dehydrogenase Mo-binding subunit